MFKIKNCPIESAQEITIGLDNWDYNEITYPVTAKISHDNNAFYVFFKVEEKNPLREKSEHFMPVHEDSCVEFFANFTPETSDYYINFEVNSNGAMNAAFRKDRLNKTLLLKEEIEDFKIKSEIFKDYWTLSYKISFNFIKKYYPDFNILSCKYIKGNLYKCGDNTKYRHFQSYFPIKTKKPDFHRPEFFGKIIVE